MNGKIIINIIFKALKGLVLKEKYKVVDFIRGGGFGDVFLAKHVQKSYDVAVKFVLDFIITKETIGRSI